MKKTGFKVALAQIIPRALTKQSGDQSPKDGKLKTSDSSSSSSSSDSDSESEKKTLPMENSSHKPLQEETGAPTEVKDSAARKEGSSSKSNSSSSSDSDSEAEEKARRREAGGPKPLLERNDATTATKGPVPKEVVSPRSNPGSSSDSESESEVEPLPRKDENTKSLPTPIDESTAVNEGSSPNSRLKNATFPMVGRGAPGSEGQSKMEAVAADDIAAFNQGGVLDDRTTQDARDGSAAQGMTGDDSKQATEATLAGLSHSGGTSSLQGKPAGGDTVAVSEKKSQDVTPTEEGKRAPERKAGDLDGSSGTASDCTKGDAAEQQAAGRKCSPSQCSELGPKKPKEKDCQSESSKQAPSGNNISVTNKRKQFSVTARLKDALKEDNCETEMLAPPEEGATAKAKKKKRETKKRNDSRTPVKKHDKEKLAKEAEAVQALATVERAAKVQTSTEPAAEAPATVDHAAKARATTEPAAEAPATAEPAEKVAPAGEPGKEVIVKEAAPSGEKEEMDKNGKPEISMVCGKGGKKDSVPRAKSAYNHYTVEAIPRLKKEHPDLKMGELMKIVAEEWRTLNHASRKKFDALASADKERSNEQRKEFRTHEKEAKKAAAKAEKQAKKDAAGVDKEAKKSRKSKKGPTKSGGGSSEARKKRVSRRGTQENSDDEDGEQGGPSIEPQDYTEWMTAIDKETAADLEFVVAKSLDGELITKRKLMDYTQVEYFESPAEKKAKLGPDALDEEDKELLEATQRYQSRWLHFKRELKARTNTDGSLDLDDLCSGSPLEMLAFLGNMREDAFVPCGTKLPSPDVWMKVPMLGFSHLIQTMIDGERAAKGALVRQLEDTRKKLKALEAKCSEGKVLKATPEE